MSGWTDRRAYSLAVFVFVYLFTSVSVDSDGAPFLECGAAMVTWLRLRLRLSFGGLADCNSQQIGKRKHASARLEIQLPPVHLVGQIENRQFS